MAISCQSCRTAAATSHLGVWGLAQGARLISALPADRSRALVRLTTKSARLHSSMTVDDYPLSPAASGGGEASRATPEAAAGRSEDEEDVSANG